MHFQSISGSQNPCCSLSNLSLMAYICLWKRLLSVIGTQKKILTVVSCNKRNKCLATERKFSQLVSGTLNTFQHVQRTEVQCLNPVLTHVQLCQILNTQNSYQRGLLTTRLESNYKRQIVSHHSPDNGNS